MSNTGNATCRACEGMKDGPVATTNGCRCPCSCKDPDCGFCAQRHGADNLGKLGQCGRLREGNNDGDQVFKKVYTTCRECRLDWKKRQRGREKTSDAAAVGVCSAFAGRTRCTLMRPAGAPHSILLLRAGCHARRRACRPPRRPRRPRRAGRMIRMLPSRRQRQPTLCGNEMTRNLRLLLPCWRL